MASRLLFFPALILAGLAGFLLWRWLGTPVTLPDAPGGRLQCLSYTPIEPGVLGAVTPGWVSTARIEEDLERLRPYTDCLRVYTPLGNTPRVLQAAGSRGFHILLGAWIGADLDQNEREISAALKLAHEYPQVVSAIVVGNEVLLRREMSAGNLAALIRRVKSESPVPVAYADVAHFIRNHPMVADAADLLMIHVLPYWDEPQPPPVEKAAEQVVKTWQEFCAAFPGKQVMIGETGWPSAGRQRGPGRPSLTNEARFVRSFAARAEGLGLSYNLIEAIDQPWKRAPEGTVGAYWGILDQYRNPKFALQGPVAAWPLWREQCAATVTIAFLVLLAGLRRRLAAGEWLAWSAISLFLGLSLTFQWEFVRMTAQTIWGWIFGAGAAALTVGSAVILCSASLRAPLPVAALAELGSALRTPLRIVKTRSLLLAAFLALVTIPAAWIGLTLAFDPRHRDIPIAQFALPAAAVAVCFAGAVRSGPGDRREEAVLAAVLLACGLMQLEPANPQSVAWLAVCALLALPWLGALRGELTRIWRILVHTRHPQQRGEHG